jgi:hypothetical protein
MWYNIDRKREGKPTKPKGDFKMTIYELTTEFNGTYYTTYFANLESAYNRIRGIEYNDVCGLYEVNTVVDNEGVITATKNRIARPKTAREIKYNRINKNENYID